MIGDLSSATATGSGDVLAALRNASRKTGLAFDYLLHTAMRESRLDAQAKSKTSSATGLFQFLEQTWLGLIKRFGERHGLGTYASAIRQERNGRFEVASEQTKAEILALRKDPELSAVMAGEFAKQTRQALECALGREVCDGELYAAHFFGPSGARELIRLNERDPEARADLAFPRAAKANRAVFYHPDGRPKTIGEVYAWAVDRPSPKSAPTPRLPRPEAPLIAENPPPSRPNPVEPPPVLAAEDDGPAPQEPHTYEPPRLPRGYLGWFAQAAPKPAVTVNLPRSPLVLTPAVVELLSSLAPLTRTS